MATQEKLLKSLELLKNFASANPTYDPSKKKNKIQHCHVVTEAISNLAIKIAPDFHTYLSITIEVLLQLCDDQDSDVRMTAGDCLNKILRAMNDGNIGKVQIELHKGIKRNGSAKSVRAALKRFSQLARLIRPQKGKAYVTNLFPTLSTVSERPEEQIHETLANSILPIMEVLGPFAAEIEIKNLLKSFLKNISNKSAVIRRSAGTCILHVCLNSRKPQVFINYVVNNLLESLIPVNDSQESHLILGVLMCLKSIFTNDITNLTGDKFLQIYELCLFYFTNKDHNVVNAALEALNVLLQHGSNDLKELLFSKKGIDKSRMHLTNSFSSTALRSPSQLSVATTVPTDDLFESELTDTIRTDIEKWIDESELSVMNVTCAKNSENSFSQSSSANISLSLENFDYSLQDFGKNSSVGDHLERLTISEESSEKSFSCTEDEKIVEIEIGTFLDSDVSLIYCGRLISKLFLLSGESGVSISDKAVRVSVKSLALSCLATLVKMFPKIFTLSLDKDNSRNCQQMSDLLLYANHGDPQLRGTMRILITNFITTVLCKENYDKWIEENCTENLHLFKLDHLMKIILDGLQDESSNCTRQTLISLNICLEQIAESSSNKNVLPILEILPCLTTNSYWLVQVALCELVSKLPFITIYDISGSSDFQSRIIDDVLLKLLENQDARVRNGAANALATIVPYLFYEQYYSQESTTTAKAIHYKTKYLSNLCDKNETYDLNKLRLIENMPFPFNKISEKPLDQIEFSLSKLITKLYTSLLTATSNNFIYGCIEVLSILSNTYPTTVYKNAWKSNSTLDIFNICIYFQSHSILVYDLTYHVNLLNLTSNLFAGHSLCFLKPVVESELPNRPWDMFSNNKFSKLTEQYLSHLMKVLNVLHSTLEEIIPLSLQSKAVLPNLNVASPIKRRKSDLDKRVISPIKTPEKDDRDKKDSTKTTTIGSFANSPHYLKIYEIVRQAYGNYKVSLESEISAKFLNLLSQILHSFSVTMEIGTLTEFQVIAEEILTHFRFTFLLEASGTVECVQQLLKCLFGNNLTTNINEIRNENPLKKQEDIKGFYQNIYQKSYDEISECFKNYKNHKVIERDGDNTVMGYLHRKDVKITRNFDKILANYIRIFEPMVIKSLKHYTITSDVKFQCKVLQLLNQLIQLRVNYCLLDSEQIFIGFVLKQFDFIEKGQIPCASDLIKNIFQFLVQLSHSKQHSKSIITIPKIIHLCDGLMASEQSSLTHCIPALKPTVENIFLSRNKSNTPDFKELETTRDVVLTMLLRLYEYHEVIDLIILILDDSKYYNNSEKWLRWSTQVVDVIIPMLKQDKIRLDTVQALVSFRKLLFVLEPSVFDRIDNVIQMIFQESLIYEPSFSRRLAKILILLLILSHVKEETLIMKINKLKGDFSPAIVFEKCIPMADPLKVLNNVNIFHGISAEEIFVKFLFKTLSLASTFCTESTSDDFIIEETSILLMYCIHILQSGSHCNIAIFAIGNLDMLQLEKICENFMKISNVYPNLMFLWCYVLILLNYNERSFWTEVSRLQEWDSINHKVMATGSIILFCDYMNQDVFNLDQVLWFLNNHILQIVDLCHEDPVSDFISSIHRNPNTSKNFIEKLIEADPKTTDPVFVLKILKSVENTHSDHTGSLLRFLLPKILMTKELAIARSVANLASRKIEFLLILSGHEQLSKEDLLGIIESMSSLKLIKKHESLASLLNKLCIQYYAIGPLVFDTQKSVNPDYIKNLKIDKTWFLEQTKEKCVDKEMVQLLACLDYEELSNFLMTTKSKVRYKECLKLGLKEMKEKQTQSPLIEATVNCLLNELQSICQKYNVKDLCESIYDLIPSISFYIKSLPLLPHSLLIEKHLENIVEFAVICLDLTNFIIDTYQNININSVIYCTELILKECRFCKILNENTHISWFCLAVNNLYKLVSHLTKKNSLPVIPKYGLEKALENSGSASVAEACHQLYILVSWMFKVQSCPKSISKSIFKSVENIIVSLARLPIVNSYILIPIEVWKSGWSPTLGGLFLTQVPPLPIEFLQEVDILEEFIYRITLLGWNSRQQFEETWMCLLSVLCNNFEDKDALVVQDIIHATSLAVKAITALLVQTMYLPVPGHTNVSKLIHISRYPSKPAFSSNIGFEKLKKIQNMLEAKHAEMNYCAEALNIFQLSNLEKRFDCYSYNQVSIKYLLVATKTVEVEMDCSALKIWQQKKELLDNCGLDINSCLQFLLDYYARILNNQSTMPLRFLHEIVRSTVIISDLFTDKSQFHWMLDLFLELSKIHTVEDELLHQYLVVGIAKSVAVLTPDLDTYECVKKLIVQYLKSLFLPSRMACLQGLLYILEGCKLSNTSIGGISEEMQIILPCAVDYVQCSLNSNHEFLRKSQEHTMLLWSLAFFLIENVDESHLESTFVVNTLQSIFVCLQQKPTKVLQTLLIKGLERLIIFNKSITKMIGKQIMHLALEKTKSENSQVSVLGIQLLLTFMYTDCSEQLESLDSQTNPDHLVQTIEKVSAMFEHIKHGSVFEAEILCHILPQILNDFFSPSDILTKVISEFLSPQQPHPKLLSGVVFRVFERAIEEKQLLLLQDWVVFSLSNFTQSLSVGMATWCLTCFLISASTNQWLRTFFPYVQSRIGRCEYEDRQMLCIAGSDFYKNLTTTKQKQTFIENFNKIKSEPDTAFNDLLSSL